MTPEQAVRDFYGALSITSPITGGCGCCSALRAGLTALRVLRRIQGLLG